jgi:hypothetical protein
VVHLVRPIHIVAGIIADRMGNRSQSSEAEIELTLGPNLIFGAMLHCFTMADEHANNDSAINEVVRILKLKIPPSDHAALDSRLQELINDPNTDDDDVISILRDEFDPA